jgi:hypothetical protein
MGYQGEGATIWPLRGKAIGEALPIFSEFGSGLTWMTISTNLCFILKFQILNSKLREFGEKHLHLT